MFLLLYGLHVCAHQNGRLQTLASGPLQFLVFQTKLYKFGWNTFLKYARKENHLDKAVHMSWSIISRFWSYLIEWLWFLFLIAWQCKPALARVHERPSSFSVIFRSWELVCINLVGALVTDFAQRTIISMRLHECFKFNLHFMIVRAQFTFSLLFWVPCYRIYN